MQPGQGAFAHQFPFELGQRPEHVENQPAAGGGRVDVLGQRPEPDPSIGEISGDVD